MKKIILILLIASQTGCVTNRMAAKIGAAGFFAGRIEARRDMQDFISGNKTLTGWQNSLMNIQIDSKNLLDDNKLQLLSGKSFDDWMKEFRKTGK